MTVRTADRAARLDLHASLPSPEVLIHHDRVIAAGGDRETIRRAERSGRIVRIRRGTYVERRTWESFDSRQRHVLRAHAAQHAAARRLVFCSITAAAFWGIPFDGDYPDDVFVLERYEGGGRSAPNVRRETWGRESAVAVALGAVAVVTPARTALELTRQQPMPAALASLDAVRSDRVPLRARVTRSELERELAVVGDDRSGRLAALTAECSPLSGSFGESMARGVMLGLGYESPVLQRRFVDDSGEMLTDFWWQRGGRRAAGLIGEFDGRMKYTRDEFTGGDPSEVVFREKRREDRLRALGPGMVRILWSHVMNPDSMDQLLRRAGVPRAAATPLAWAPWAGGPRAS